MSDSLNLRDQLQSIIRKLEAIPEMKGYAEPFRTVLADLDRDCLRIGVIGITSAGKSTFLNVLLGRNLLPEQSKATTNMVVYCRKGPRLTMEVIWQNGKPPRLYEGRKVTPDAVAEYCCEDKNPENIKGVERVVIRSPEMMLLDGFELVDTPGIDAYGHEEHEELTLRKFLPKADIVLYTTSIKYPIKQADARVLGQVVQNDQRVLFVQTFKDAAKNTEEKGIVIKTREQELRQHLKRIQDDVEKCAPSLKTHLFCQISSYLAKDPLTYRESGFDELLQDIRHLGSELDALIQERLSGRVMRHLDLCLGRISEMVYRMEGDLEAAAKEQRKRDTRIEDLKACRSSLNDVFQSMGRLDETALVSTIGRVLVIEWSSESSISIPATLTRCLILPQWWTAFLCLSAEMKKQADDHNFLKQWNSLLEHIQELQRSLLSQLDHLERTCQAILEKVSIAPFPRDAKTLDSLPSAPKAQWESVTKTVTERRWYTLWLYKHERKVTEVKLDRKRAKEDLISYTDELCRRVNRHMDWWHDHCAHRYLAPVLEELASAEKTSKVSSLCPTARLEDVLGAKQELTVLRERIDVIRKKSAEITRPDQRSTGVVSSSPPSRSQGNLLRSLLHSRRELEFHRQLLACVNRVSSSSGTQTLLCIGGKKGDHEELIAMLTHRLKDVDSIRLAPGLNVWCHPDGEPPRFFLAFKGKWELHLEPRRLINRLSVISHSPEGSHDRNPRWADLFESVDAIAVFVNCSQIGSGLNDIENSDWIDALSKFRRKAFYVGLDMSYYRSARAHELVTQVLPALRMSSLGSCPYLLADQYDTRFTRIVQYGEKLLKSFPNVIRAEWDEQCREAVLEWETNKISFRLPFTRQALLENLKRIYDDRHAANYHMGSSARQ